MNPNAALGSRETPTVLLVQSGIGELCHPRAPWFLLEMLRCPRQQHRAFSLPPSRRTSCQPSPCPVYFRIMGASKRRRWSAVKTFLAQESMIFANVLEIWLFSQGQCGSFAKTTKTPLASSQITLSVGKAPSLPAQTAGRKGVLFLQSSFNPSSCLLSGQLFPSLDRPLEVPSIHKSTWEWLLCCYRTA